MAESSSGKWDQPLSVAESSSGKKRDQPWLQLNRILEKVGPAMSVAESSSGKTESGPLWLNLAQGRKLDERCLWLNGAHLSSMGPALTKQSSGKNRDQPCPWLDQARGKMLTSPVCGWIKLGEKEGPNFFAAASSSGKSGTNPVCGRITPGKKNRTSPVCD